MSKNFGIFLDEVSHSAVCCSVMRLSVGTSSSSSSTKLCLSGETVRMSSYLVRCVFVEKYYQDFIIKKIFCQGFISTNISTSLDSV